MNRIASFCFVFLLGIIAVSLASKISSTNQWSPNTELSYTTEDSMTNVTKSKPGQHIDDKKPDGDASQATGSISDELGAGSNTFNLQVRDVADNNAPQNGNSVPPQGDGNSVPYYEGLQYLLNYLLGPMMADIGAADYSMEDFTDIFDM